MPYIDKEEVTQLAFKRYCSGEDYDRSIWFLAELCCIINKNIKNGDEIRPLESDNVVLLLQDNVDGQLIKPTEEEIKQLAELIASQQPERSKLHWFIAEKTLLLDKIRQVVENKHNQ